MAHIPGQYISIKIFLPEISLYQARQYSVSSAPTQDYYRISVKAEKGANIDTNGLISNHLHEAVQVGDMVNLTAPAGDFQLDEDLAAPVVLISGGVGLTPMMSMLQNLVEKDYAYPITWLHGCRNRSVHAFKYQLDEIVTANEQVEQHVFYDAPSELDKQEGIIEGFLDLNKIAIITATSGY